MRSSGRRPSGLQSQDERFGSHAPDNNPSRPQDWTEQRPRLSSANLNPSPQERL